MKIYLQQVPLLGEKLKESTKALIEEQSAAASALEAARNQRGDTAAAARVKACGKLGVQAMQQQQVLRPLLIQADPDVKAQLLCFTLRRPHIFDPEAALLIARLGTDPNLPRVIR